MSADRQHPPRRFQPRAPMAYDAGMEARVAVLEQIAKDTRDTLMRLEGKIDRLDGKIDGVRSDLDGKTDSIRERQERDFRLLFGALIATALGLAMLMAHGFKWIP